MATNSKVARQNAKRVKLIQQEVLQKKLATQRWVKSQTTGKFMRFLLGVFGLIAFVFLVFVVFKKTYGGSSLSFTSFLNWLSNRDNFSITIDLSIFHIDGNWGLFDGLRIFLDGFAMFNGVIAWLGANVVNIVIFLSQFILFIFS